MAMFQDEERKTRTASGVIETRSKQVNLEDAMQGLNQHQQRMRNGKEKPATSVGVVSAMRSFSSLLVVVAASDVQMRERRSTSAPPMGGRRESEPTPNVEMIQANGLQSLYERGSDQLFKLKGSVRGTTRHGSWWAAVEMNSGPTLKQLLSLG